MKKLLLAFLLVAVAARPSRAVSATIAGPVTFTTTNDVSISAAGFTAQNGFVGGVTEAAFGAACSSGSSSGYLAIITDTTPPLLGVCYGSGGYVLATATNNTGVADSAAVLSTTPDVCTTGQFATGIDTDGDAQGCNAPRWEDLVTFGPLTNTLVLNGSLTAVDGSLVTKAGSTTVATINSQGVAVVGNGTFVRLPVSDSPTTCSVTIRGAMYHDTSLDGPCTCTTAPGSYKWCPMWIAPGTCTGGSDTSCG